MNHELICSWLGLPSESWPPDHYCLLGLEAGESDLALIEQRVHQRLDTVRRYQMTHPEQATEAMNRLAQAFVCLTEAATKKAYDGSLKKTSPPPQTKAPPAEAEVPPPPPIVPPSVPSQPTPPPLPNADTPRDALVWLYTPGATGPGDIPPPPVRVTPPGDPPPLAPLVEAVPLPPLPVVVEPPPREPVDPILEAAQRSPQARRNLATRRALHRRVSQTRHLLRLWHRAGKYVRDPETKWTRQDASELYRLVEQIEDVSDGFPLLGEAGHSGHLIFSLTHHDRSRELLTLDHLLRESLKRDWESGVKFLEAHRDFLREEIVHFRQQGRLDRGMRAVRAWLNDKPLVGLLVLVGLLAVGIAVWRSVFLSS